MDAYYDIIIVGGGAIGCSVAFWFAQRINEGFKILVVERDPQVCIKTKEKNCSISAQLSYVLLMAFKILTEANYK